MSKSESANSARNRTVPARGGIQSILVFLVALTLGWTTPTLASASDDDVQTAWRLLDYVAVDYPGAVADRQVKNPQEYAEMTEFSSAVEAKILGLPASASRAGLIVEASAWRTADGTRFSFLASTDQAQAERHASPDAPGIDAVRKEAEAINARLGGWIYTLPGYKTEQFTRRLQDLLAPASSP